MGACQATKIKQLKHRTNNSLPIIKCEHESNKYNPNCVKCTTFGISESAKNLDSFQDMRWNNSGAPIPVENIYSTLRSFESNPIDNRSYKSFNSPKSCNSPDSCDSPCSLDQVKSNYSSAEMATVRSSQTHSRSGNITSGSEKSYSPARKLIIDQNLSKTAVQPYKKINIQLRKNVFSAKNITTAESYTKYDETTIKLVDGYESLIPVWIEKGQMYRFFMRRQVSLFSNNFANLRDDETNTVSQYKGFPKCAMLGRILSSDYFLIKYGEDYMFDYSGPLIITVNNVIRLNLSDSEDSMTPTYAPNPEINPKMIININSALLSFNDIEIKLGWDTKELTKNYKSKTFDMDATDSFVGGKEKDIDKNINEYVSYNIYLLFNKLRKDPRKFAEIYLKHLLKNKEEDYFYKIYDILVNSENLPLLDHSVDLTKSSTLMLKEIINMIMYSDDTYDSILEVFGQKYKNAFVYKYDKHENPLNIIINFFADAAKYDNDVKCIKDFLLSSAINHIGLNSIVEKTHYNIFVVVFN